MTQTILSAKELLLAYLTHARDPERAGSVFAEDGILELPTMHVHVQGPAGVASLLTGLLKKITNWRVALVLFR